MVTLEKMRPYEQEMINIRRDLHMHPETGFDLTRTSGIVEKILRAHGCFEVVTGIAQTGVVGIFRSDKPGKTIAIRADMDALKMDDELDAPYRSTVRGAAHTCGHDAHTSMLLGVAHYIAEHGGEYAGVIKLLFQPSEESDPRPGAPDVVASGILDDCDAIFGLHVDTAYRSGQVGVRYGALYAGSSSFRLEIQGKGGHGAYPHIAKDPIVTAAQIINAAQTIVSRGTGPMSSAVVSFCTVSGGNTCNVIPETTHLAGTTRALEQRLLLDNMAQLDKIIHNICDINDCRYKLDHEITTPVLFNDPELTKYTEEAAVELIGRENVIRQEQAEMGGEDFAYYCALAPCSYFILGVSTDTIQNYCHHPKFDIDEKALIVGAGLLAAEAAKYLGAE